MTRELKCAISFAYESDRNKFAKPVHHDGRQILSLLESVRKRLDMSVSSDAGVSTRKILLKRQSIDRVMRSETWGSFPPSGISSSSTTQRD